VLQSNKACKIVYNFYFTLFESYPAVSETLFHHGGEMESPGQIASYDPTAFVYFGESNESS